MKFLCLIYHDERERDAVPAEQWQAPGRFGSVEVRPVWEREDLVARRVTASRETESRPSFPTPA